MWNSKLMMFCILSRSSCKTPMNEMQEPPGGKKQEAQNFPGRNELSLLRKKASVAEIEETGNGSRYDPIEVGRGQIIVGGTPGQCEEFAFYSDLWDFKARPLHCNYSFPQIFQLVLFPPKLVPLTLLWDQFLGWKSRCLCPGGEWAVTLSSADLPPLLPPHSLSSSVFLSTGKTLWPNQKKWT